jgi:hypothetical protein
MDRDAIKELLGIPQPLHLLTILPFGYAVDTNTPRRQTKKRPAEVCFWGRFGQHK